MPTVNLNGPGTVGPALSSHQIGDLVGDHARPSRECDTPLGAAGDGGRSILTSSPCASIARNRSTDLGGPRRSLTGAVTTNLDRVRVRVRVPRMMRTPDVVDPANVSGHRIQWSTAPAEPW